MILVSWIKDLRTFISIYAFHKIVFSSVLQTDWNTYLIFGMFFLLIRYDSCSFAVWYLKTKNSILFRLCPSTCTSTQQHICIYIKGVIYAMFIINQYSYIRYRNIHHSTFQILYSSFTHKMLNKYLFLKLLYFLVPRSLRVYMFKSVYGEKLFFIKNEIELFKGYVNVTTNCDILDFLRFSFNHCRRKYEKGNIVFTARIH